MVEPHPLWDELKWERIAFAYKSQGFNSAEK